MIKKQIYIDPENKNFFCEYIIGNVLVCCNDNVNLSSICNIYI